MVIGAWFILMLLLIWVCIVISSLECKVVVYKSGKYERISIFIRCFFGRVRWRYEWRAIRLVDWQQGLQIQVSNKNNVGTGHAHKEKGYINVPFIQALVENINLVIQHTDGLWAWTSEALDKVTCQTFIWETEIGLLDPAATGMATGASWCAKWLLIGLFTKHIRLYHHPDLNVISHQTTPYFSTRLVCITQIGTAQAISVALKLIIRIVRAEGGVRTWRNILSRA